MVFQKKKTSSKKTTSKPKAQPKAEPKANAKADFLAKQEALAKTLPKGWQGGNNASDVAPEKKGRNPLQYQKGRPNMRVSMPSE